MENIVVARDQAGRRLDQVIMDRFQGSGPARVRVQAWIRAGCVEVDGTACARPSRRMAAGEMVKVNVPPVQSGLTPEAGDLGVLYRDEQLAVLNKPAGLVIHPAPGLDHGTLAHRLLHHFPALKRQAGGRPGIVHRLDKDTTGLMVVALEEGARRRMAEDFAARRVEKSYLALVYGRPACDQAEIDAPIGRHPALKTRMAVVPKGGRPAQSNYQVLWSDPRLRTSLLHVRIRTGRTHQIRVHLEHIGHPLLGDPVYSARGGIPVLDKKACSVRETWLIRMVKRPMLHAWRLSLSHPRTREPLQFELPPPKDFLQVMLFCLRQVQRVGLTGLPGCGKSVLAAALARTGLSTWNADQAVRELYRPGQDGWDLLRRRFGARFVPDDGPVDTVALLAAMRESSVLRREVESLVHPLVTYRLEAFWQEHAGDRAALAEVPLLVESGWQSGFDVVAGLFCPEAWRRQWLEEGRGWSLHVQTDVESWQQAGPEKLRSCDIVLENPRTLDGMALRALALVRVLQWLRRQKARTLYGHLRRLVGHGAGDCKPY